MRKKNYRTAERDDFSSASFYEISLTNGESGFDSVVVSTDFDFFLFWLVFSDV